MRKMKGVAAPIDSSTRAALFEDPRTRFRHETLMEDYKELYKETEVMRRKLEIMKQKRATLMAEVRFLRRRYKDFTQSQTSTIPTETKFVESRNLKIGSKSNDKKKKQTGEEAGLRPPVPRFDLNKKTKVYKVKGTIPNAIGDLNKRQKSEIENEPLGNPISIPDLNQAGRTFSRNENTSRVPVFDLNLISREEEELQANGEQMAVEDSKNTSLGMGNAELQNEIKLSVCRNIKKGSSRAGKRKVSWQDPVALRV